MATIPVNPERRDPGYLRKKAEIGLSNVDNISATDFTNTVADDVKIIGNRKITTNKVSSVGKEHYFGILMTQELSSHVNFTTGLYSSNSVDKELAQFNVDFSFSTPSAYEQGSLSYSIQAPDSDKYLKNLELLFTQVGTKLYISLYTKELPSENSSNYFDQIGTDIVEWTEGTTLIGDDNLYNTIKGGRELARVTLKSSTSTVQSDYMDSLPVYNKTTGERVLLKSKTYSQADIDTLDCPTINGVPFTAKKGLTVNNQANGTRNITIQAKHSGSTKDEAGGHDWEVLNNIKAINTKKIKGPQYFGKPQTLKTLADASKLINSDDSYFENYGLCKPSKYSSMPGTYTSFASASEYALGWLETMGPEDTDVITVGMFRTFMQFLFNQVLSNVNNSDKTETVEYSEWKTEVTYNDAEKIPCDGSEEEVTIRAYRTKTTTTYDSSGEVIDSTEETEYAINTNISVEAVDDGGDDISIYYPALITKNTWTIKIANNSSSSEKTHYIAIKVIGTDEGTQIISFTQEAYTDTVSSESDTIYIFDTTRSILAESSTVEVEYSVKVDKTYASGVVTTDYYTGDDVKLSVSPEATVSFKQNGIYQVTYPENTGSEVKQYTLTLSYKDLEKTLTVNQSAKSEEDVIIGVDYIFTANPSSVVFDGVTEKRVSFNSESVEQWSSGKTVKIDELSFTVESKPDWISVNKDSSDFIYNLVLETAGTSYRDLSGNIVLKQQESTRLLVLPVTQVGTEVTVVSDTWSIYTMSINTSSIKLEGETRDLSIIFKRSILYSDGTTSSSFYSGKDISVSVSTVSGDGTATAVYDGGWKIKFPKVTSKNTYSIKASYNSATSDSISVYQGNTKTKTEYIFEPYQVVSDDYETIGFDTSTNTINVSEAKGGSIKVKFNTYTKDYYEDGSTVTNSSTVIPFSVADYDGKVIKESNLSISSNVLTIKLSENTSLARTGIVQVTQENSEKGVTLNIEQVAGSVEYYLVVNGKKYTNGETCNLELPNSSSSLTLNVSHVEITNGVETKSVQDLYYWYDEVSWLTVKSDASTGKITFTATENTTGSKRVFSSTLSYIFYPAISIVVTQNAGNPYITIDGSTGNSVYALSKSKESQVVQVTVDSNFAYEISGVSSWATLVSGNSNSAGSSTIAFNLSENNSSSDRSCDFTLTSEGGTNRIIRITQLSREHYIDVDGFENSDLLVTLSDWKNLLAIPIKANQQVLVDYYSDWLSVCFHSLGTYTSFPYPTTPKAEFLEMNKGTSYLYVKSNSSDNKQDDSDEGVISLSYYDETTGRITCGRKIYVRYIKDLNVLPYGPRDIFVSGGGQTVDLYAYTKDSSDLKIYMSKDSDDAFTENFESEDFIVENPKNDSLNKLSISISPNSQSEYINAFYTLGSSDSGLDYKAMMSSGKIATYGIHQYPNKSLQCHFGSNISEKTINIPAEGYDLVSISASASSSSGYWELYANSLPGWISIVGNPYASAGGSLSIRVEPNSDTDSRTYKLQFWCDSDVNTINTLTITQSGSTAKASGKIEYDYSLVTASTSSNYIYLYGVSSASISKVVGSDGKTESTNNITTTITKGSNYVKIDYSVKDKNTYYNKDIYKILDLVCTDGVTRQFFIKNPRTQEINITVSKSQTTFATDYSGASNSMVLTSNIGLTSFYQETVYEHKDYRDIDFTTLEVASKATNTSYNSNYENPAKLFHKPQIMDKLLLKNMDILPGYTYEHPIILPEKVYSITTKLGIAVYDENYKLLSDLDSSVGKESSFTLTLPSSCKNSSGVELWTIWYFKAYDGVTVSSSGSGFKIVYYQSDLTKKIGSLGNISLSIGASSDNTSTSDKYLGYVKLTLSNGTVKTIQVYQKATSTSVSGNTGIYGVTGGSGTYGFSEANLIYNGLADNELISSWSTSILHEYPNWMILDLLGNGNKFTFNGKSYSGTFGNGGNSGTATSTLGSSVNGCSYRTSVAIVPPSTGLLKSNATLELVEGARFGISSAYGTDGINNTSNTKAILHVYTRPDKPEFTVYNSSGVKVIDSDGNKGTGAIISLGLSSIHTGNLNQSSKSYPIIFRLTSNYIDNCKNYVGKTVKINGQNVKIETEYDVFTKLVDSISVDYKLSIGILSSSSAIRLTSYTTGTNDDGNSYIQYSGAINLLGNNTISSGTLNITLNDFVIDSKLYTGDSQIKVSTPITFTTSTILNPDIQIEI